MVGALRRQDGLFRSRTTRRPRPRRPGHERRSRPRILACRGLGRAVGGLDALLVRGGAPRAGDPPRRPDPPPGPTTPGAPSRETPPSTPPPRGPPPPPPPPR